MSRPEPPVPGVFPVHRMDIRQIVQEMNIPLARLATRAVPMIAPDADEEAWLTARRQGVTASDMAIILRRSPYSSPFALWHAKKGGWDKPRSEEQLIGLALEDTVADLWAKEMADEWIVCRPSVRLWAHPLETWLMCSPDRLAMSEDGEWTPIEVKTDEGGKGWGAPGSDDVPFHFRVQVMIQMGVFGASRAFIARLGRKASGRKYATYEIPFDQDLFDRCVEAGAEFLVSLSFDEPPEIDGHHATLAVLQHLYPETIEEAIATVPASTAFQWLSARAELRRAKKDVATSDNRLRDVLGEAALGMTPDGHVFVKRSIYERQGYTTKLAIVDQLREVHDDGSTETAHGVYEGRTVDVETTPPDQTQEESS